MNKAIELAAITAEDKSAFAELANHRPSDHCCLGRVATESGAQVGFKFLLQVISRNVVATIVASGLHEQGYPSEQLFLIVFANETDWHTFIMQMPVNIPSLDKHCGGVVIHLPPFPRQLLVTADNS